MGKTKVLVKVHPEGKYVVDIDKTIDITKLTPGSRVALRNDSYVLHKVLPNKVDPLVSLMRVEKVPDSTYDMIGGLDKQIREMKEVMCLQSCGGGIIASGRFVLNSAVVQLPYFPCATKQALLKVISLDIFRCHVTIHCLLHECLISFV